MGRPRKFINNSIYPDEAIEALVRVFLDDIIADISETSVEKPTEETKASLPIAN